MFFVLFKKKKKTIIISKLSWSFSVFKLLLYTLNVQEMAWYNKYFKNIYNFDLIKKKVIWSFELIAKMTVH